MKSSGYIKRLEETISKVTAERDDALKRSQELEKENLELKKRLVFYENPNTPPSARTLPDKRNDKDKKKSNKKKKRGAPKGHRGATRPKPEPDEVIDVIAEKCIICGSTNIEEMDQIDKRTIEDLPPPQEIKVIEFIRHWVRCLDCHYEFLSKHPDCPQIGYFGIFLLVYITMLKFHLRGVLRKIQEFLLYSNNFQISTKGIHDILLRVGGVCKAEYDKTIVKIRNAEWVHVDETGIKVNGKKYWLWIFRTNNNDILVVIRRSRGGKVVDEILGPGWSKPLIVDGWKAYWKYPITQRCWAHLLRMIDAFKDTSENGKQLSKDIHRSFNAMKKFLEKDPPMDIRMKRKEAYDKKMTAIFEKYSKFDELRKPTEHIKNGFGNWYTCLLYPGMEPTTNLGEQAIREHVIMRTIIGCFRSKKGAENYQYISSLLASWRLQNKNIFEELEDLLRKELCLS
jgi:transposase